MSKKETMPVAEAAAAEAAAAEAASRRTDVVRPRAIAFLVVRR